MFVVVCVGALAFLLGPALLVTQIVNSVRFNISKCAAQHACTAIHFLLETRLMQYCTQGSAYKDAFHLHGELITLRFERINIRGDLDIVDDGLAYIFDGVSCLRRQPR